MVQSVTFYSVPKPNTAQRNIFGYTKARTKEIPSACIRLEIREVNVALLQHCSRFSFVKMKALS